MTLQTAAHELGHSLGLSHSDVRSALMAPFYRGWEPNLQLNRDDMEAIQVDWVTLGGDEYWSWIFSILVASVRSSIQSLSTNMNYDVGKTGNFQVNTID